MSRKDYEAIARVIRENEGDIPTLVSVAKGVADIFAADNARFDRQRFYAACDLGPVGAAVAA